MTSRRAIHAPDAPQSKGGYAQALEVTGATRTLYVSGQIPESADGKVPEDFESQARLCWQNIGAQLRAAGMTLDNLVKATIFLSDRRYAMPNRTVRNEVLAGREIALTVIICDIFDDKWLLEIEAIAAA
ncbi:RidA family protein [Arvimicrobium flavum]|uniref:RidA family protein n=1 Tax=Arvimicrobium flavum TaxID=3393320 RepID=UPI00237B632F|nr:RidA family protein [Mesorhizobium shangrilense]